MDITLKPISEQVMVITGASSGIGLATAFMAANQGAKVVLVARSDQTLQRISEQISGAGHTCTYTVADVAKREDLEKAAQHAISTFGRIDTWVNNAGVSIYGRLEEISEEDGRRLFDTNFWGLVNGSLVALTHLRQNGGALINVGSEVSDAVVPLQGLYSASKHAVKGFTDALRIELQDEKVPVSITLIQPTAVNTPYPQHARNYMNEEPKLPDPQIDPAEVAEAILDAATHERRDVRVGTMSKVNSLTARIAPRLADWMAGKQIDRQQYEESPRHPEGALFQASEDGHIYGSGGKTS